MAQQYIERGKRGSWKKENTEEALKCWNLERIFYAEQQGKDAPSELNIEDLLNEELLNRLQQLYSYFFFTTETFTSHNYFLDLCTSFHLIEFKFKLSFYFQKCLLLSLV